jgi:hypothetical protein
MAAVIDLDHRMEQDGTVTILATSRCSLYASQTFEVATVLAPDSANPGLMWRLPSGVVTVGMAEKVCAYVRIKPWKGAPPCA